MFADHIDHRIIGTLACQHIFVMANLSLWTIIYGTVTPKEKVKSKLAAGDDAFLGVTLIPRNTTFYVRSSKDREFKVRKRLCCSTFLTIFGLRYLIFIKYFIRQFNVGS